MGEKLGNFLVHKIQVIFVETLGLTSSRLAVRK